MCQGLATCSIFSAQPRPTDQMFLIDYSPPQDLASTIPAIIYDEVVDSAKPNVRKRMATAKEFEVSTLWLRSLCIDRF